MMSFNQVMRYSPLTKWTVVTLSREEQEFENRIYDALRNGGYRISEFTESDGTYYIGTYVTEEDDYRVRRILREFFTDVDITDIDDNELIYSCNGRR